MLHVYIVCCTLFFGSLVLGAPKGRSEVTSSRFEQLFSFSHFLESDKFNDLYRIFQQEIIEGKNIEIARYSPFIQKSGNRYDLFGKLIVDNKVAAVEKLLKNKDTYNWIFSMSGDEKPYLAIVAEFNRFDILKLFVDLVKPEDRWVLFTGTEEGKDLIDLCLEYRRHDMIKYLINKQIIEFDEIENSRFFGPERKKYLTEWNKYVSKNLPNKQIKRVDYVNYKHAKKTCEQWLIELLPNQRTFTESFARKLPDGNTIFGLCALNLKKHDKFKELFDRLDKKHYRLFTIKNARGKTLLEELLLKYEYERVTLLINKDMFPLTFRINSKYNVAQLLSITEYFFWLNDKIRKISESIQYSIPPGDDAATTYDEDEIAERFNMMIEINPFLNFDDLVEALNQKAPFLQSPLIHLLSTFIAEKDKYLSQENNFFELLLQKTDEHNFLFRKNIFGETFINFFARQLITIRAQGKREFEDLAMTVEGYIKGCLLAVLHDMDKDISPFIVGDSISVQDAFVDGDDPSIVIEAFIVDKAFKLLSEVPEKETSNSNKILTKKQVSKNNKKNKKKSKNNTKVKSTTSKETGSSNKEDILNESLVGASDAKESPVDVSDEKEVLNESPVNLSDEIEDLNECVVNVSDEKEPLVEALNESAVVASDEEEPLVEASIEALNESAVVASDEKEPLVEALNESAVDLDDEKETEIKVDETQTISEDIIESNSKIVTETVVPKVPSDQEIEKNL
ncbi:hypothetical protein O9G_001000, partial [Rozella allomycis CSF55]